MESGSIPLTAKDALELWDSGKSVPAFQIETTPERQTEVYAAAFELIRETAEADVPPVDSLANVAIAKHFNLTKRDTEVAHSIAHVAKQSGWAKMVSQHIHRDSPAISVKKP